MSTMLEYKGYLGSVEYSDEALYEKMIAPLSVKISRKFTTKRRPALKPKTSAD